MITYAPGFAGFTEIRRLIGTVTGNDGRGSSTMPSQLLVTGLAIEGAPIALHVPNSVTLASFLESKIGVGVYAPPEIDSIPFQNWISLNRALRSKKKNLCAKAIIMAYLAANNFIQWT